MYVNVSRLRLTGAVGAFSALVAYVGRADYTYNPVVMFCLGAVIVEMIYSLCKALQQELK
jgi:hypothetical protein